MGGGDSLSGGALADTLVGGAGADTLTGNGGDDTFIYATGTDLFANSTAALTDSVVGGSETDTIRVDGDGFTIAIGNSFARASGVETLAAGSISGNAISITLNSDAFTMAGIRTVTLAADNSAGAINLVDASSQTNASVQLTLIGSVGSDQLTGGAGNDSITGGGGLDLFTGGGGVDTLVGGAGQDIFVYGVVTDLFANGTAALTDSIVGGDGTSDVIRVDANGFAITATNSFARASGVEMLIASQSTNNAITIALNASAFTAGIRTVSLALDAAGAGSNSIDVSSQIDTSVGLTLIGSGGSDAITGGAGNDSVTGGIGSDTITGGGGVDTLDGGANDDTFAYAAVTDLFANGTAALTDSIVGGAGTLDVIRIDANGFTITAANSFARASEVERLSVAGASSNAISITLNADAFAAGIRSVVLTLDSDTSGSNTINAASQTDAAVGLTLIGSSGTDSVTGGAGNDTLTGLDGNDNLSGGDGADSIAGGIGADILGGGAGRDIFTFAAGDTSLTIGGSGNSGTLSGFDVINDFALGAAGALSETIDTVGTGVVAADVNSRDGNNSMLTISSNQISSHRIQGGLISFDDADNFNNALTLNSIARVAAAVQYLQANDIGSAGTSVFFTATISGAGHTYVYTQGSDNGSPDMQDVLVDLVGVLATSLSTINAQTAGLLHIL